MVAMDSGTCRSGRTGSAPQRDTCGDARGLEEGQRLRGEMRQPIRGEKRVRRDAEWGVMVEAPPASPIEVIEPPLVLQLLVVPLDTLWHRLLGRPVSESGRFCHGDGSYERGDRRRWVLMLAILRPPGTPAALSPAAPDRHPPRSRGHPEDPRARGGRPLRAEPRPRPSQVRRRHALIGTARERGGRRRACAVRHPRR